MIGCSPSLASSLLATIALLAGPAIAQSSEITVWSSVIFQRTGERTPAILGNVTTQLTSAGAQQAYAVGEFFRQRYLGNGTSDGVSTGLMPSLNLYEPDQQQVYVQALDSQCTIASAQAWMQGFYPPILESGNSSFSDPTMEDAFGYVTNYPLGGYQYAQIRTAGSSSPERPFLAGTVECFGYEDQASRFQSSPEYFATTEASQDVYSALYWHLFSDVAGVTSEDEITYYNAYAIYDYLNYYNAHNASVYALLSEPVYLAPSLDVQNVLDTLRYYADQQQYGRLSNISQINTYTNQGSLGEFTTGSISTLPGNLLAAKVLAQMTSNIETAGEYYKLSVLVGDFEPLLSFFALTSLPDLHSTFYGLPEFASSAAFELFSYTTNHSTDAAYPDLENLFVRFYFRNGSDSTANETRDTSYIFYPLFGRDPNEAEMTVVDFVQLMAGIEVGDIATWCTQCGSEQIYCSAYNSSLADSYDVNASPSSFPSSASHHALSPAVGGVIGAIVSLAVAGLLFAGLMLFGGVRVHRVAPRSRKGDLGGFKGGQKMASDQDLTIPKGGASASVAETPATPISPMGHERAGSWELKNNNDASLHPEMEQHSEGLNGSARPSFESRVDPFMDPVKADERV